VRPGEHVYALLTVGDSLIDEDIHEGDLLIFVCGRQSRPGDLCVVQTPLGLTAKFAHPNEEGEIVLKSANERIEEQIWPRTDVVIVGVVQRVERRRASQ